MEIGFPSPPPLPGLLIINAPLCIEKFPRAGPLLPRGRKVSKRLIKKFRKRFNLEKSSRFFGNLILHYVSEQRFSWTEGGEGERELSKMALGQRDRSIRSLLFFNANVKNVL